jgi:hypothetical protein
MIPDILERKFTRIGARLKHVDRPSRSRAFSTGLSGGRVRLDVQTDGKGEFFAIVGGADSEANVEVLDVQPTDRHLLLMVRQDGEKSKFLCGHDERHWFVAAVPESAPVGTVRAAKEALKPVEVQAIQARLGLRWNERNRRKNAAYRRQGEWFFVPAPDLQVDERLILRDEPITRGAGSKPHRAEFCYRSGGENVYVCTRFPNGLTERNYRRLLEKRPEARNWSWSVMSRNAAVYVRGRVRHADHKTITLDGWHRVLMNTESQAKAMRHVAFLD